MPRHRRRSRIEWGDCDPAGIVFYPRYFAIFDASTALLFEHVLGLRKAEMLAACGDRRHPDGRYAGALPHPRPRSATR